MDAQLKHDVLWCVYVPLALTPVVTGLAYLSARACGFGFARFGKTRLERLENSLAFVRGADDGGARVMVGLLYCLVFVGLCGASLTVGVAVSALGWVLPEPSLRATLQCSGGMLIYAAIGGLYLACASASFYRLAFFDPKRLEKRLERKLAKRRSANLTASQDKITKRH